MATATDRAIAVVAVLVFAVLVYMSWKTGNAAISNLTGRTFYHF